MIRVGGPMGRGIARNMGHHYQVLLLFREKGLKITLPSITPVNGRYRTQVYDLVVEVQLPAPISDKTKRA